MIIYKITNIQNNKVYIGQTINSLEARFKRHKNDALKTKNPLNTHFARAIRKYGPDSFIAEVIDSATTQEELNQKEQSWIRYYDSVNCGYNETDAIYKSGGNAYQSKTKEELKEIGEKIRQTKLGANNPNRTAVKCKNVITGEEIHFNSQAEAQAFFGETNHQFISRRVLKKVKCLYKEAWLIAYEEDDYISDYTLKPGGRSKPISVTNTNTGE